MAHVISPEHWYLRFVLKRGPEETRVLVALEEEFRAYREVLAAGVESMRTGVRVATTVPINLEDAVARFDPQVIICSGSAVADAGSVTTWIELSIDPSRPTVVRLGGRRFERINPTFEALLDIIDETGRDGAAERVGGAWHRTRHGLT